MNVANVRSTRVCSGPTRRSGRPGPWDVPEEIGQLARRLALNERQTAFLSRFGLLRLAGGAEVGCHTEMVPEGETDHIGLYLPRGCLEQFVRQDQSMGEMHSEVNDGWRQTVDAAFVQVAEAVYRDSPFELASWGEEAGCISATAENVCMDDLVSGGYLLSPGLAARVGALELGTRSESGFIMFPYAYD